MSNTTKPKKQSTRKPTHTAYVVRDFKGSDGQDHGFWREIGAAWAHKDAKGFDLTLDAIPITGRLVLRLKEAK